MTIAEQMTARLKDAMRAKDRRTLSFIRMLKAAMTETTKKPGFNREVDDALWLEVIAAYAKQQKKALAQNEALEGDGVIEQRDSIQWEITACDEWLPKKADEVTTREWVRVAIESLGGPGAHFGAVMGAVMKAHRDEVDPSLVRRLAEEMNTPST